MEVAISRGITTILLLLLFSPVPAVERRAGAFYDDALEQAIGRSDEKQVKIAVEALATVGTSSAMESVITSALLSGHPALESAALVGLRNLQPGSGLDWLCTQATKHPRKEVRDLLLGLLSQRKETQCFRAVLQGLYDEEDSVALKAIEVLKDKAHPGSIPHMVRALQHQEDRDRDLSLVAERIRQMLKKLTGADLFASSEWDALWKGNKKALGQGKKLDPAKIILKGSGVKVVPPAFFGQELVSEKIVFILDTSISMQERDPLPGAVKPSGKKESGKTGVKKGAKKGQGWEELPASRMRLRRVQKELKRMIRELPRSFKFCLVTFDEDVDRMSDHLVEATPDQKRRALKFVDNFDPEGLTSTDRALESAFKIPGVRSIVLLSDGMPYRSKDPIDVLQLLAHIEEINRFEHIPIHTVGFASTSGNAGGFLGELSRRNNGTYTEVP
ncbi:MAG: hypothetical protein OSB09_10085 [Planctomycetota bacterium]|nr:hypothetical protein [Planctomycetota bacterium]